MPAASTSQTLDELFGIDIRGLTAFRIAIGLLVMIQAVLRLHDLPLAAEPTLAGWLDLDWLIVMACGAAIAAGRGVSLACLLAWPLLFRHVQAEWNAGGIQIHRYLLLIGVFWLMLVPADRLARAGAPPREKPAIPRRILSFATAALLVQVLFVYLSAGMAKSHVEWLLRADALENLMFTRHASPLGRSLVAFPWLLQALSIATVAVEVAGPIACFVPCRQLPTIRIAVILLVSGFHLGLQLTMNLDTIPMVCQAYWLLLVPSGTWDRLWPRGDLLAETAGETHALNRRLSQCMLAGMTASFLLSALVTSDPTGTLLRIHHATPKIGLYQDWRMFRSPATLRRTEARRRAERQASESSVMSFG
ncbi:MAG: HTTM domain-containing protein [Planctomycetaceae bacterium]|nr:HTTM domain-containing protein [Planctomycetaceae bacterium]